MQLLQRNYFLVTTSLWETTVMFELQFYFDGKTKHQTRQLFDLMLAPTTTICLQNHPTAAKPC